jgi:3-isopropylmalate/(R)-2-methylmalate dehydratase large subunit
MFDKIWDRHRIVERQDGQVLLFVDRHLVHDGTAAAFVALRKRGLKPRAPERIIATADHFVPTDTRDVTTIPDAERRGMIEALSRNAEEHKFTLFGLGDRRQGIVHVIGPEEGLSQPGMLIVCADSHTPTHGALGAIAIGVGMTETTHVLATQTLWQRKPKLMRITVEGKLGDSVVSKDVMLAIIAQIGAGGATGYAIEFAGSAITGLSIEGRLTLCNMSIEAGAKTSMVAPDESTFSYIAGRPYAPKGHEWDVALAKWSALPSDPGAVFDMEVTINSNAIEPMVTWGTSPEDALPISGIVPDPGAEMDLERRNTMERALAYMGLTPGTKLEGLPVDRVFIGSCTNGRIEDLRLAADVVRGRRISEGVQALVVPGSGLVKEQAEAEGLHQVFLDAGFQWRQAGCSMCLAANGDMVAPGLRCASTSNRNFVGRQGPGARTHLMGPAMAAAAAVTGRLTDIRTLQAGR